MTKPKRSLLQRSVWRCVYYGAAMFLWGNIILAGALTYYSLDLPSIDNLEIPSSPPVMQVLAYDGTPFTSRGQAGEAIHLERLPPYVSQALIAIEDRRFFEHFGLDLVSLARAMWVNIRSGRIAQGGSTISQQLAKNLFLNSERSLRRKMQEAVLALWLEAKFEKSTILELYLSRVYFGAGAYGLTAAAKKYFRKDPEELSIGEAALLVGVLKAPSALSPTRNPDAAYDRTRLVLRAMVENGYLGQNEFEHLKERPYQLAQNTSQGQTYILNWVREAVEKWIGPLTEDVVVVTSLDPYLQRVAEITVSKHFSSKNRANKNNTQVALISLRRDGGVQALIGGRDLKNNQFNRAFWAHRQPGSAFKPFVYLAALEDGFEPETIVKDEPVTIDGWSPRNYNNAYSGFISLRKALARSVNSVAVQLGQAVGLDRVINTARRLGVESKLHDNASLPLGTSEVTLLELTNAYTPFSNGGFRTYPYLIQTIHTRDGTVLFRREPPKQIRAIAPDHVAAMNDMLAAVVYEGTGRSAYFQGWPIAGKTGTTQMGRDGWFIGLTGHGVTGVWIGTDQPEATGLAVQGVTGGKKPARIWRDFTRAALQGLPIVGLPGIGIGAVGTTLTGRITP